jgi:WD40 repeat protein
MGTGLSSLVYPPSAPTPFETVEVGVVPRFVWSSGSASGSNGGSGVFILTNGEDDETLELWDGISNELLWSAAVRNTSLLQYYSAEQNRIFRSDTTKTAIQIIELDSGNVRTLQGAGKYVHFTPSHDGSKFLIGRSSGKVTVTTLWRHDNGLREVPVDWSCVCDNGSFSHDDTRIISLAPDATIHTWDTETGKRTGSFTGLSNRGHIDTYDNLLAMCYEMDVKVWNLITGTVMHTFTTTHHTTAVCIGSLDHIIVAYGPFGAPDRLVCWNFGEGTVSFDITAAGFCSHKILRSPTSGGFCTFSYFDRTARHYDLSGQLLSCSNAYGRRVRFFTAQAEVVLM